MDCNRRHEKPKVVHSDKEWVQRVFRIVEVQDESLVKPGLCLNRMRILVRSDTLATSGRRMMQADAPAVTQNNCDEIYACKVSVRNKNMEQK